MNYGYGGYPTYFPAFQTPQNAPQTSFQQPQVSNPPQSNGVRLVASKAEVVAAQIPFDGNEYFFKDTSNGKIYSKTFNFADGTAPIVVYSKEEETQVRYATLEDIEALKAEIESIKRPIKVVKKHDADE